MKVVLVASPRAWSANPARSPGPKIQSSALLAPADPQISLFALYPEAWNNRPRPRRRFHSRRGSRRSA